MKNKVNLTKELQYYFVEYAKEINRNRAFPFLLSGVKPVVEHTLWSMWANGRRSNKPYTKSAKIEGEVMSFNPHAGVYGTMVRLTQNFIHFRPFIDGHGSFGSPIGGATAGASRYTQCRLSEFSEDVLFYNTKLLDMGLNYLEEEDEPILYKWVSLLPLLLMSNNEGIGYTISNSFSSVNLLEFRKQLLRYLKTGKVDCSKIYPDFPTGGVIVNKSDMKQLFETGKGVIKLRGVTEIDGDIIKVLSLPYQCYPEQFLEEIKKYVNDNDHTIKDVHNLCGNNGFLIEIICEKGTANATLNILYNKTCLQTYVKNDWKAVTDKGKPEQINLQTYMESFVKSNLELVIKEAKYNLSEINNRLEIVNGLLSALDIINKIINTIKKASSKEEAKKEIQNLGFTERQSKAIIDMQLGKLANLEKIKLQSEKDDLVKRQSNNQLILDDEKEREKFFLNRFNGLVKKYGWERRTELKDVEEVNILTSKKEIQKIVPKKEKEYMVCVTSENTIKSIELNKYRKNVNDLFTGKFTKKDDALVITENGVMYKIPIKKIDLCLPNAQGMNFDLLGIKDKVVYLSTKPSSHIIFVSKLGLIKKCEYSKSFGISKKIGATVMSFKQENDYLYKIYQVEDNDVIPIQTNKRILAINVNDIKVSSRNACGKNYLKKNEKWE